MAVTYSGPGTNFLRFGARPIVEEGGGQAGGGIGVVGIEGEEHGCLVVRWFCGLMVWWGDVGILDSADLNNRSFGKYIYLVSLPRLNVYAAGESSEGG